MYTYLIVDDEPLIRKGTIKKLMPLSDRITCCAEAENGQEAIALVRKFCPDLVILDMQMPVMDGMQLLPYLAEHYPDTPLIVISGYQNFDYMKQSISSRAVDYILKPFSREEIQKTVLAVLDSLANKHQLENRISLAQSEKEEACYNLELQSLENMILGYKTDIADIHSSKLSFINSLHRYVLFTMYYFTEKQTNHLQNWLSSSEYGSISVYLSGQSTRQLTFLLLFLPEHTDDSSLISRFQKQLAAFLSAQGHPVLIGVSRIHSHLSSLNTAFRETKNVLNTQPVCPEPYSCFFYPSETKSKEIDWNQEDELLFRIESGAADRVNELSREFFAYCRSLPDCTLLSVKHYCERLCSSCYTILNSYLHQSDETPQTSASVQAVTDTLFTLDDLEKYYCQFFSNLTFMLQSQSVYANAELIDRICIYIRRNYQKNLTQEYIASLFYLNRSYLSQLFHQKTGEKFIDYLNGVRIEKAKNLLENTDKKMYQISKAVGYDNVKYFFRIFKKKTGISPQAWRDQYGKEDACK